MVLCDWNECNLQYLERLVEQLGDPLHAERDVVHFGHAARPVDPGAGAQR